MAESRLSENVAGPFVGVAMRWKQVAWVGCLPPVFVGCHTTDSTTHDRGGERFVFHTESKIQREIRKDAREAWHAVRSEFPRKAFTPEFHDGFLDGYSDYLDRGGNAQPPAVPPPRYTRNNKYFTPEGHALIRDYFLGFKYGIDVATVTGQRQYLTVPVLLSQESDAPLSATVTPTDPLLTPTFKSTSTQPSTTIASPLHSPRTLSSGASGQDSTNSPSATSANPNLSSPVDRKNTSSVSIPRLPGTDSILPPKPTTPQLDRPQSKFTIPKSFYDNSGLPASTIRLPEPPASIPNVPASIPMPVDVNDPLPMTPLDFPERPPLPVNHPDQPTP